MKNIISGLIIFIFILLFTYNVKSQINHGGKPLSTFQDIQGLEYIIVNELINTNDTTQDINNKLKPFRFAQMIDINLDIKASSFSKSVGSGTLYITGIISNNAFSLYPVFTQYNIPTNSSVFIYNPAKSSMHGKFTCKNNNQNEILAIMPIAGDTLIIEYFEPNNIKTDSKLILGQIGHDYKGVFSYLNETRDGSFGQSGDCNVDINCYDGTEWQKEKKSVCRIITGGSLCSGSLINNTNHDARPFFLTANHCINSQALADAMLIVFNYESPVCNGPDGSVEQSLSGGLLRSTTHHLDFSLIELFDSPLPSFNPYFAGWNRSDTVEGGMACIHHPQGDVKKISIDTESPVTDNYGAGYDFNTHWLISDWESGTTEGGSSGSPLFDKYHRIIGDLTGGEANCTYPVNDYYSKFSEAWDTYSNSDDQLKFWLDPTNTGELFINGYNPYYGQQTPSAEFSPNRTDILQGSTISYTDLSEGNVISWNWTFEGGIPSTSIEQHPQNINYPYNGTFTVSLEVSNNYGSDVIIKNGLITVSDGCARFTNLYDSEPLYLYSFSGSEWGYWTGHNELEFTSFAEKYTNQSGNFIHGVYILTARAYNSTPSSQISINVWEGGGKPGNIIRSISQNISSFNTGIWKYIEFEPGVETDGNFFIGYSINYSQPDTFAVPHAEPRGAGGLNTTYVYENNSWSSINQLASEMNISLCVEPYICGSLSTVEKQADSKLNIYPNPTNNILHISPSEVDIITKIKILNSNGQIVLVRDYNNSNHSIILNLGIYWRNLVILSLST